MSENSHQPIEEASFNSAGTGDNAEPRVDENWYLNKYPDVSRTLSNNGTSATDHYLTHGRREGRLPCPIVHLHIPKTAGTSVRGAFQRSGKTIFLGGPQFSYNPAEQDRVDIFSGHFGFNSASSVKGDRITILRDPVDRFISFYYHLIRQHKSNAEISERTIIATKYTLEETVCMFDNVHFVDPLFNGITWQIAYGTSMRERMEFRLSRSPSELQLLDIAKENLDSFSVVGFQHDMPRFWHKISDLYGLTPHAVQENKTDDRLELRALSADLRRKIESWVYLDLELYQYAIARHGT